MTDSSTDTPRRRVAVVINPMRTEVAEALLTALQDVDVDVDVDRVADAADLADAMASAIERGADIVAAVGGDGTQHTAARVLHGTDHALAVVPGGTVNLLGQVLGITSAEDAARAIAGGDVHTMDLGTLDDNPFLLSGGTGFDAKVMDATDDGAKRFGRLGYFVTGWRTLRADRPREVTVLVDGDALFSGRAMSVIVANVGQRASSEFTLIPGATHDDGRIDVLVQRCDTPLTMARAGVALARGRRPRTDDIVTGQGTTIEVRWAAPVISQMDGDAAHTGQVFNYGVLPGALRVCTPPPTD